MSLRAKISFSCALFVALAFLAPAASAARPLVAKDGKIHACYKFRGKHKGALRVVHGPRVRCSKKWRKVAWYVRPPIGSQGTPGPQGAPGPAGPIDTVSVEALENKVTELLNRVESLETVVGSLCTQTEQLNQQTTALGSTLGSLGTVLEVALVAFEAPAVPAPLPSFSCPAF